MKLSRRSVLTAGAGGVAIAAGAGCLSEPGTDDEATGGYAAFFALWDWAQQVSDDAMEFENPVETGEIGHGWEPPADLQRDIAGSNVFVYLDTPEFTWAQDVAADLERDTDVTLIDAMAGLEGDLLPASGRGHDHEEHAGHDHGHEEHDDHDHETAAEDGGEGSGSHDAPSTADPHVWVDPVLAQTMVGTIAEGLAEIDPDNATVYEENAASYVERLEAVDRQFVELADAADRDTAVFAGHSSFQYLERRYGFELHTPVGISPNDAETESDIAESIAVVDEHDIDTILYDPFETTGLEEDVPQMVELLLETTDADEYAPLSAVAGTTPEWDDRGWGWIEQMEEVNAPSLRRALGAE